MAKKIAAGALFLLVTTSIFAIAIAKTKSIPKTPNCTKYNSSSHYGSNSSSWSYSGCSGGKKNDTQQASRTIIVKWERGIDYQQWTAMMNAQLHVNDTLLFQYPNDTNNYTLYLLPDMASYINCAFNSAKLLASTTAGAAGTTEVRFVLKANENWSDPNIYFACKNHCRRDRLGRAMALSVNPMPRY